MDRYRLEMDRLGPRAEKLEELYGLIEGGTDMKKSRWIGRKAAAVILACAVLTVTAAAAAVPAAWEVLMKQLGAFAPYAQNIQGAVCQDQGIKVQMLSALSDDLEARFYFSVQDVEGDRLNEQLTLNGSLENGTKKESGLEEEPKITISVGDIRTKYFKLISYDPETKTALFSASINYWNDKEPGRDVRLSLTGMTTEEGTMYAGVSCAAVTEQTLDSLPMGEQDKIIFRITDIANLGYTEAILPSQQVVLAPEQNPMPLEGTQDMWVSSIGFASDGCFHVRLGLADGVLPAGSEDPEGTFFSELSQLGGEIDKKWYVFQSVLVPNGLDILFPLVKAEDLEQLRNHEARFYGCYMRPGTAIEGSWDIEFQLEHHPSAVLDWTGELAGRQVDQVTLSPLSVTMNSNDSGGFHNATLYAVREDGSTVAAEPSTSNYSNTGGLELVWNTFNTWKFVEPVDLEKVVSLSLMGETIPIN